VPVQDFFSVAICVSESVSVFRRLIRASDWWICCRGSAWGWKLIGILRWVKMRHFVRSSISLWHFALLLLEQDAHEAEWSQL